MVFLLLFSLWAISQPPRSWLRCSIGAVWLGAASGDTNTWRSPETRVTPQPGPAHMAPLARLPRLTVKRSSGTSRWACDEARHGL